MSTMLPTLSQTPPRARAKTTQIESMSRTSPEAKQRQGIRSQGNNRTNNRRSPVRSKKKRRRRKEEELRQKEHAELLAHARAAQQAAFVVGMGAITVGQDTPPMTPILSGSDFQPRRQQQQRQNNKERSICSPESSSVYYTVPLSTQDNSMASSYARSRYSGSTATQEHGSRGGGGVSSRERLHTPDLEMMKMAMHGSLFQRMRQNFRAGMFGDETGNSTNVEHRGGEIMYALNAGEDQDQDLSPIGCIFHEQDASTMMALTQRRPPEATTVLFGEGSPLSRQGFASNSPRSDLLDTTSNTTHHIKSNKNRDRDRNRKNKKTSAATLTSLTTLTTPTIPTTPPTTLSSSSPSKQNQIDPNFSRRLLPLVDASHYWDVRNVSHELKWSAIAIQRMVRGLLSRIFTAEFRYRKKLAKMKKAHEAAILIQRITRGHQSLHAAHDKALKSKEGQFLIQSSLCDNPYEMKLKFLLQWMKRISGGSQGVQKIFRGMIGRRYALGHKIDVLRKRLEKKCATSIQALFRSYKYRILWRQILINYNIIRIWLLNRLAKLHAIVLGKKIRAHYLCMKAAAIEIQKWFPRALETRSLAFVAREDYKRIRKAIIVLQSFNRMIIATNRMNYMSAVREQERLAEKKRIQREKLEAEERVRVARWTKAAIVVQKRVRYMQAVKKVAVVRLRKSDREATYQRAKESFEEFKQMIPENGDVRKLTAKPLLGFVFMHIEPTVSEDVALLAGKNNGSMQLDTWYQHNLMTQPKEAMLHYIRSLVEYYRTLKLNNGQVQESLKKARLLDPGLLKQHELVDILETAWRNDMDSGYKGCMFALARTLYLNDMLGAARAMRRARKNSKYDAKIVSHAKVFEKDFSALVARGDHFVDQVYETTLILPPQRAKFRIQVLQHENNLQFRSLRSDFVIAGVKPSGAETRLVFTHLDIVNIATQLDRPELTRSGRVKQLVLALMPMLRLETGAAAEKTKARRPGGKKKKKGSGKKAGGKRLIVRFKQEPFPKLTLLTKGKGTKSLPPKFLTVIVLHRDDGGFDFWAKGDMTDPPPGNPNDDYKLVLPFKKLKLLFLDYPVLWQSRKRPGWRRRSDQLIALVLDRLEVSVKPKPKKMGVHEMSFEELMRMSAAVDQQKKQLEGDKKGEKVPDMPPELILLYHNEKGRIHQASLNYGGMAMQRCWQGLKGRRKAKMERQNQASFTIVGFIKFHRARVWFRDVCIFAKRHFRAIILQSIARSFLIRLAFQQRLIKLFPFSRGSWQMTYPALICQRPLPLKNGKMLSSNLELSKLTQRIMWTLTVEDDDESVCSTLHGHESLHIQPNLIYSLAIATRMSRYNDENIATVIQMYIEQARAVDPERGRKFLIVRDMFFERWRKIQSNNALKTLRCAIMYEIVYNDFDKAQQLYNESKKLLQLNPNSVVDMKWKANYDIFHSNLNTRILAAKQIQTLFRGHCNKRVHGEWLAALIKFRRTSLIEGFTGTLAQALGSHFLWHDLDRAVELYSACQQMSAVGSLLIGRGREWVEKQFDILDKLKRGGLTEKQYHVFLELAALPIVEETELNEEDNENNEDNEGNKEDNTEDTTEDTKEDNEKDNEDNENNKGNEHKQKMPDIETDTDADNSNQTDNPNLSNLNSEREDKTHFFQPRSQSARDIFNAIGTADAEEVPQLEIKEQEAEEEEERERTQTELYAMDYFGDIPKNEDGIRVSLDNMWDWSLTICAGKEHGILDVASVLINVLNKDSISSVSNWGKAVRNAELLLEEKNLTAETFDNNSKETVASMLELETNYIRLAARMPQDRSSSLLNHALFLHLVRQNFQGAGASYSSALCENPGNMKARRGYEYFINLGMLAAISPKQQKIQARMRRKKRAKQWRRESISKSQRIEKHLSVLLEIAAEATADFEQIEGEFLKSKVKAKKINKLRSKEEYTEEDIVEMKIYKKLKKAMRKKEQIMNDADEKVIAVRQEREDRKARDEVEMKE